MLEFTDVKQQTTSNGVKVLAYGPAGIGKTVLCATAPKPVILSAESGLLSLRQQNLERLFGVNNPTITYNAPVILIKTVDDLKDAHTWLTTTPEAQQFQSVCIDSISEIAEVVLNNAKKQVNDPRQAYGALIEQMEDVIRTFRDIPNKNIIMLAKMEPQKDGHTGVVTYGPSLPGSKLGVAIPYFPDEVFRLGINTDNPQQPFRFLQTQPCMQYQAKDRSGVLNPIEEPNFTKLFNKILQD